MSILKTGKSATLTRTVASVALALTAVAAFATAGNAVTATQQVMTPSSGTGSTAGGNTLTLSLATTATPKFTSGFVGVQFQATTSALAATATCATAPSTTATSSMTATTVRYLSSTKVSVVVPALTGGSLVSPSGFWLICAYNAAQATGVIPTSATVIGKANYVAAAAPTINAGDTSASPVVAPAVVPASGPASGGQVVTINGTGFPTSITTNTPLTATFAGIPLTNITPISSTQFTAVTPSQPASTTKPVLTVTTNGGSVSASLNATPNTAIYTYVNGITVSPNTVASGTAVDVDVQGTGFTNLDFATASNTDGAHSTAAAGHVYLVQGTYNPAVSSSNKTVGESDECTNVAVISDSELICTVDAAHSITYAAGTPTYGTTALANGTYTVTVVNSGAISATLTYKTVLSSGATFTVADF
jgi:hypothetical protein